MATTVTKAAIKTELTGMVDALYTLCSGTPLTLELEAGLARSIVALKAAGTIENGARVVDA